MYLNWPQLSLGIRFGTRKVAATYESNGSIVPNACDVLVEAPMVQSQWCGNIMLPWKKIPAIMEM